MDSNFHLGMHLNKNHDKKIYVHVGYKFISLMAFFLLGLLFIYFLSSVLDSSFPSGAKKSLLKLGVPSEILEFLFSWVDAHEDCPKIPEAKGAISSIRSEAFFIPLYELFLTYGGVFRLNFGPKVCLFLFLCMCTFLL